jgi:hypothetical protein
MEFFAASIAASIEAKASSPVGNQSHLLASIEGIDARICAEMEIGKPHRFESCLQAKVTEIISNISPILASISVCNVC